MIITIDGPAGSGKSTVAKNLASKLNMHYLNTGLLYRAVAYILIEKFDKKISDLNELLGKDLDFVSDISYEYENEKSQIFYEDENLTSQLHESLLDQPASIVSANKNVREKLLPIQRDVAKKYKIVAEGRDCGSVVFPNADYKFFLTASLQERAKRVMLDKKRGESGVSLEKIKEELELRDQRDKNREVAPLTIPDNAIIIENSGMDREETLNEFLRFIK